MQAIATTIFLLATVGCSQLGSESPTPNVNVAVVERFVFEVFGEGNLDVIDEIISPDYVGHWAGWGETRGREALRRAVFEWRTAFPDWAGHINDVVVDGDMVAVRLTSTGTFLGPWGGHEPNQRRVELAEFAIMRIVDGVVLEHWELTDSWSLERQLGIRLPDSEARPAW